MSSSAAVGSDSRASRYHEAGFWSATDLWSDFALVANTHPRRTAITSGDQNVTYGLLRDAAFTTAAQLADKGVAPGDVVALFGRNSPEAAVGLLACLRLGAVAAPLPPMFGEAQLHAILLQCGARAVISFGDERATERCRAVKSQCEDLEWFEARLDAADGGDKTTPATDPDELAFLLHSSGTTSQPKGIMHSQNTLRYAAAAIRDRWNLTADDVYFVACEWGFVGSLVFGYLPSLLSSARIVLMPRWDAASGLALLNEQRCTYGLFMPTHSADLLHLGTEQRVEIPTMRVWAAPGLSRDSREQFLESFGSPLAVYGLSEVPGHAMHGLQEPLDNVLTTEGVPLPGTEIRIVDESAAPVPEGSEGHVEVDGPSRFLGFYRNLSLTETVIAPWGGYKTGDRGLIANAQFVFRGRSKDIIRRGGVTIVPGELEAAIARHPDVREVAVVPMPHARLGESACAAVIPTDATHPIALTELLEFLELEGVSKYTWPESLEVFEEFPRTPSLKVIKRHVVEAVLLRQAQTGREDA